LVRKVPTCLYKKQNLPLLVIERCKKMKKNHTIPTLMLLGLVILFALPNFVSAQEGTIENPDDIDGDGINNDIEEKYARELQVEVSSSEIQVESVLKNGEQQDSFHFGIKFGTDGLQLRVEYENEDNSGSIDLQFEVDMTKIIEFIDSDADGIYNPVSDAFVKEILLNSFSAPIYATEILVTGETLHKIDISTTDGVFNTHFYVVEEFVNVNGSLVTPAEVKFDIEIINFPYSETTSLLALYVKLESESEYNLETETENEEEGLSDNEESVETSSTSARESGFLAWNQTAIVDGSEMPVRTSAITTDENDLDEEKMYIIYTHGAIIYHDPTMGVCGIISLQTLLISPIIIIATMGLTVLAVVLIVQSKKRQIK
jgi:hypothetical protein